MIKRLALIAPLALLASAPIVAQPAPVAAEIALADAPAKGVIRIRSHKGFDATIEGIKADVAAKGVKFFGTIDQAALGAGVDLRIRRSTLVLFGNPPLGVQFLQSNPYAGLDWPVRMLVIEDADGSVWIAWSDFAFIADRYAITDRAAQLKMASEVAASIADAAAR
ncbi:DUF302 domain-containing protein [Sphingomonas sp.]|uniref:DUF302 domain-containing protein n=1 Tax=Sphingomonas sp. TaxID=28214 RepID=UPI001B21B55C|nr:DUF302 domain-containing protein [Sphingomonas sp.]MBO9711699.1 DUF302 domain-containing protein [Sphingomonas sp.]